MATEIGEFSRAGEFVAMMKTARNLGEYEKYWKDFLHQLERGWNKWSLHSDKVGPAVRAREYVNQCRKSDELIQYLQQARHCDEHLYRQIVTTAGECTTVTGGPGGGSIIRGIIRGDGIGNDAVVTSGNIEIVFHPRRLEVITVLNRNKLYEPPKYHLSVMIKTRIPHELADLGLSFYMDQINRI